MAPVRDQLGVRRFLSRRVIVLGSLFYIVLLFSIWVSYLLIIKTDGTEKGLSVDYLAYYSGSTLALRGEPAAAYDTERILEEQRNWTGEDQVYAWLYPPPFFFIVLPLALLPLVASVIAWFGVTTAFLLSALRRINNDRAVLFLALAFPATLGNFIVGQNGMLTAAVLGWGLILLHDRPRMAGLLLGCLIYKPHFFPLIPIALWAGGHRAAAISTVASAAGLCLASLAVFGLDSWSAFVSTTLERSDLIYTDAFPIAKMQSVTGLLLALGASPLATKAVQAVVALACVGFVQWLWRRDGVSPEYRFAGLTLAILLASPYSFQYDLTLMGLAALWLGVSFQRQTWRRWDAEVLLLAFLTPVLTLLAARFIGITIGPFVLVLLLLVLLRRVRGAPSGDSAFQEPLVQPAIQPAL